MRKIILFFSILFLWTCGGGGSTGPSEPQLPTVTNIELITAEDTPKTFAFAGTDPSNQVLTYSISTEAQHGSISISGGAGIYSPNANYNGTDVFAYIASSTNGSSNIGTVIITITPVDDQPSTMDITANTDEDNSVTMTLEAEEVDGQTIQFNVTGNPSNGSVNISGTTAIYTPDQDFNGTDTFNFEAVDASAKSIINTATATITVNPINDAPIANNMNNIEVIIENSINITLQGVDVDNDDLTYTIIDQPTKGSISLEDNIVTYSSLIGGEDSFTYKTNDGQQDSNVATVVIDVTFNDIFLGSDNYDLLHGMKKLTDGDIILVGSYNRSSTWNVNSFLAKVNSDAEIIWINEYNFGSNREGITSVVETSSGDYYFSAFSGTNSGSSTKAAILRTDSGGNPINFASGQNGSLILNHFFYAKEIIATSDNNYIITVTDGVLKIDEDGNEISMNSTNSPWGNFYNTDMIQLPNDEFIILTSTQLIKLDESLNELSNADINYSNETVTDVTSIVRANSGEIYVVGTFDSNATNRVPIIKFDDSLNQEWRQDIGLYYFLGSTATSDGGVVVAGTMTNQGDSNTGFYKIDSSGNQEWFTELEYYGLDNVGIVEMSDGTFLVAQNYSSSETNNASNDIFIFKLDANGQRIK